MSNGQSRGRLGTRNEDGIYIYGVLGFYLEIRKLTNTKNVLLYRARGHQKQRDGQSSFATRMFHNEKLHWFVGVQETPSSNPWGIRDAVTGCAYNIPNSCKPRLTRRSLFQRITHMLLAFGFEVGSIKFDVERTGNVS